MITQAHIQTMIQFTNAKIEAWYKEAFNSYGVKGAGKAHYNKANDEVVVECLDKDSTKVQEVVIKCMESVKGIGVPLYVNSSISSDLANKNK